MVAAVAGGLQVMELLLLLLLLVLLLRLHHLSSDRPLLDRR
jgi:hypothetical protein